MKHRLSILLIFFLLNWLLHAQELQYHTKMDWAQSRITVLVEANLTKEWIRNPLGKDYARQYVQNSLDRIIIGSLSDVLVDSWNTYQNLFDNKPELMQQFCRMEGLLKTIYDRLTPDLKTYSIEYQIAFYPYLTKPLIHHYQAIPIRPLPDFTSEESYSGIVIYAKGNFAVHGTSETVMLRACLLPKLYSENMSVILDSEHADPVFLQKWGMVAYTSAMAEDAFTDRIGKKPLRIVAYKLFGKHYTDIVLSQEDVLKILTTKKNIQLLSECRILILCNLP